MKCLYLEMRIHLSWSFKNQVKFAWGEEYSRQRKEFVRRQSHEKVGNILEARSNYRKYNNRET